MKKIITAMAGMALVLGLSACGGGSTEPLTSDSESASTTATDATTTTSSLATPTSSVDIPTSSTSLAMSSETEPSNTEVLEQPVVEESYSEPTTVVEDTYVAPQVPVFMDPEDFDPYGPPRFVECWERDAAVMSDGSIVTDTVNCAPDPVPPESGPYGQAPPADGCVGPAATCGYYDEYGNPIWFDKTTGETSPRYYDEYGNPTMESP